MDPRESLHLAEYTREVLVAVARRPGGVNLMRDCGRRHRHAELGRLIENQSEILVHEFQRELRRVVIVFGAKQLVLMRRRDHRCPRKYFQQEFAIESRFFPEGDRLGDRLHVHTEQSVDDQFHRGSGTARPKVKILLGYCGKDWLAGVEHARVAATEESQNALLSARRTA